MAVEEVLDFTKENQFVAILNEPRFNGNIMMDDDDVKFKLCSFQTPFKTLGELRE